MRNFNEETTEWKPVLEKTLKREHWYPLVNPSNYEMKAASLLNNFLDELETMSLKEIDSTLRMFKASMMNIALAINKEL